MYMEDKCKKLLLVFVLGLSNKFQKYDICLKYLYSVFKKNYTYSKFNNIWIPN